MYKDKEAQKEANKQASQRYRAKGMTEGMTKEGMTEGMTLDEGQRLHKGAAPGAKILSDGQLWYPGNQGYHPSGCDCGIEHRTRP